MDDDRIEFQLFARRIKFRIAATSAYYYRRESGKAGPLPYQFSSLPQQVQAVAQFLSHPATVARVAAECQHSLVISVSEEFIIH